jgi:hypothetical protein
MDNFFTYDTTHEQVQRKAVIKLKNTTIIFLPLNVTLRH